MNKQQKNTAAAVAGIAFALYMFGTLFSGTPTGYDSDHPTSPNNYEQGM